MKVSLALPIQLSRDHIQAMFMVVGLSVAMTISMAVSIFSILDQLKELSDKQSILNEFETRLTTQPNTIKAIAVHLDDYQIASASAPRAAASLQKWINAAFTAYGGTVLSTEIISLESTKKSSRIELSAGFLIDEASLQATLHAIETFRPAIYIDEIAIKPMRQVEITNTANKLQGNVFVSGLWAGSRP